MILCSTTCTILVLLKVAQIRLIIVHDEVITVCLISPSPSPPHTHTQSLGVLFTVAGFVVIFLIGSYSEPNFAHAIIGIVLTALLIQQYLSGIL